jgi:hypothetical protein
MRLKLASLALLSIAACHANNVITLSVDGLPSTNQDGTYNGFASATINGISNQLIICDDYTHVTYVPSGNMVYDFSTVGGNDALDGVRFDQGSPAQQVHDYEEAAVLVWELYDYVSANGAKASANTITDYQYALWNIFDSGITTTANQAALQAAAVSLMTTQSVMLTASVYPYVDVYTPSSAPGSNYSSNQEFLQYAAPEPGTLLLLAGGLLVATAAKMRRELRKRPRA